MWRRSDCHRTILAYVAGGSIEDRSGHVSPCYWTTWPSLVLPHFRFLLDHVSGPCYFSCQFSISTRVMLQLEQVSLLHWTMCRIFIGPRGYFLFNHVSWCCRSTFRFWLDNVAWRLPSVCQIFISTCVVPWLFHVSCTGWSSCHIFIWSCGLARSHAQQSFHQNFFEIITVA
jgi:hypothetical protein